MAQINLLPWREQLREERKQRFLASSWAYFVVAAGLVFLGDRYLQVRSNSRMRGTSSSKKKLQFWMLGSRKSKS